jgi:hypothetical protein
LGKEPVARNFPLLVPTSPRERTDPGNTLLQTTSLSAFSIAKFVPRKKVRAPDALWDGIYKFSSKNKIPPFKPFRNGGKIDIFSRIERVFHAEESWY